MINCKQTKQIVKQLESLAPEREVLVLADNETSFLRKLNEENNERPQQGHSLVALVVDGVKERVFNQWARQVRHQNCKDDEVLRQKNKVRNKIRLILNDDDQNDHTIVHVQLIDVQNIMNELKKGTFQIIDLIVGIDFVYEYDSPATRTCTDPEPLNSENVISISTPLAAQKQPLHIYHQTESWRTFVNGLNFHSVYGYEYARSCACIMHKISKESKGTTLTAQQQSYIRLLNERVFRCAKLEEKWRELKQYDANYYINYHNLSMDEVMSMHAEYFPMIISGCKESRLQPMGNLRCCKESVIHAFTSLIHEKRQEAMNRFTELSMSIMDNTRTFEPNEDEDEFRNGGLDGKSLHELFNRLNPNMDANSYLSMDTNKVAMVARTGSYLYNLNTKRSDEDYTIIYFHDVEEKFPPNPKLKTHFKRTVDRPFGSDKAGETEYNGLEMMTFLSNCCKGDSGSIDLLFIDPKHLLFCSREFLELRKLRYIFLVERRADKYLGVIINKLGNARKILENYYDDSDWRTSDRAKFAKHLYLAFFRMFELKRFLLGEDPIVRLETNSDERRYIMNIREVDHCQPSLVFKEAQSLLLELKNLTPKLQRPSEVDLNLLSLELEKMYCRRHVNTRINL